jgi:CubicO group peptidase (beta-lactamase class C family)
MAPSSRDGSEVSGAWSPRFSPLASELGRQLRRAAGTGAALAVYHRGERVVDAWGGTRDATASPWERDTRVMGFSCGKGVAATLLHTLVDEGRADYDAPVAEYWPEFASAGKAAITLRQLLSHQAGLYRLTDIVSDFWSALDFSAMAERMAAARPAHAPGEAIGYHAITFSWLVGELIQRIGGARLAAQLEARIARPLALDGLYFGLPEEEFARCAELMQAHEPLTLFHTGIGVAAPLVRALSLGRVRLDDLRASLVPPASGLLLSWNDRRLRRACLPSSTGVFTARALAGMYAGLLDGRLLSPRGLASASAVQVHGRDRVVNIQHEWRLGYHGIRIVGRESASVFGHCGYRGTGAFADPERELSFAFLHNAKDGLDALGGPRFQRLAALALACADG